MEKCFKKCVVELCENALVQIVNPSFVSQIFEWYTYHLDTL